MIRNLLQTWNLGSRRLVLALALLVALMFLRAWWTRKPRRAANSPVAPES
ncbi:MAG TPA: hypothetical protein PKN95_09160 [Verrucomicrobiota bacterium]|nr:hypothetical protein [Verrucomicrobiota bacterium]HNT14091.1 hypothetical protein [Verrucomicrobiota bacterium]